MASGGHRRLLAIDPGTYQSALVLFEDGLPVASRLISNEEALGEVRGTGYDHLAIEMVASYGMPVGADVFQTTVWIGRFVEASRRPFSFVYRKDVKMHLCGHPRANDSNIRQALIDRFGGKERAIGLKKNPGPLYGIKKDLWSALAVGITYLNYSAVNPSPGPAPGIDMRPGRGDADSLEPRSSR